MSRKLKILGLPLTLLSLSIIACSPSLDSQVELKDTSYKTSQLEGDGEEIIENPGDEIDLDNLD